MNGKAKFRALILSMAALLFLAAGCSNNSQSSGKASNNNNSSNNSSNSKYQPMTIATDDGSPTFKSNFNPFSPNMRKGVAWIYETLYFINSQNGKQTPWLATNYKWNNSKELTFTVRNGVNWNDGKPFTAADVAFTFNLLKKYPALDTNGLWQTLSGVTAQGNKVVFKFKSPDTPALTYISETPIVPKHVWKTVKDPVKWTNSKDPVGTGAFVLQKFTPYQYILKRNPKYWQANKIHESTLTFPALNGAQKVDLQLSQGKFDWAQAYVPDVEKTYISKDPKNRHYWYAPSDASNIVMNLTKAPFNNVKFRQAMEYAINRKELSAKGENGYDKPASPSGLRLPGQKAFLDQALAQKYPYNYNPKKAKQILKSAGFKESGGKLMAPNGKPVSFDLEVPTGWTDWITDCNLIKNQLAKLGITVNVKTPSVSSWSNDLLTTNFDVSFTTGLNQYNPWFYYNLWLNSSNASHGKQQASGDYEHWVNKQTDQLLNEFKSVTDDSKKKDIIKKLQKTMYTQVPIIPLFYNANWNQYSTKTFVGWPNAKNPYATPSFAIPDVQMIMTHLTLKK